jgi:tetratricopeptide (TPR) repeat protein
MSIKPKSYSRTDPDESRSKTIFDDTIDPVYVKSHVEIRTTTPNIDGYVFICERPNDPFGLIFVQLKKIPRNKRKYQCEAELFVTGDITLAPFILVCVDVDNRKVFWKQLLPGQIKPDRKSAVVHFKDEDEVNSNGEYLKKWVELVKEHKTRISSTSKVLEVSETKENIITTEAVALSITPEETELTNYRFKNKIDEAKALLDDGKSETAKKIYENLLLEFGNDPNTPLLARFKVHNNIAICFLNTGDEPSAIIHFKIAYDVMPAKSEIACRNRALTSLLENLPLEGIPFIDQALEINPGSIENINMKVRLLNAAGKPEEALKLYLEKEGNNEN